MLKTEAECELTITSLDAKELQLNIYDLGEDLDVTLG